MNWRKGERVITMNNEEIIKKAIAKVNRKGLDCELSGSGKVVKVFRGEDETEEMPTVIEFIFSHDFAMAYWGVEIVCSRCGIPRNFEGVDGSGCKGHTFTERAYEFHLKKLVLRKQRLDYIARFV